MPGNVRLVACTVAFSSSLFLFAFLPATILTSLLLSWRESAGKIARLLLSFAFYLWGDPIWFSVLLFTTLLDWRLSQLMAGASARRRRLFLGVSIGWNAGALLVTKYTNFFFQSWHAVVGGPFEPLAIIMPLGISFITFQKISYMVEVYRGGAPAGRLQALFTYVFFFPNIISGPIARWNDMAQPLSGSVLITHNDRLEGMYRFILGLAKKVLIGNVLGREADAIFALPAEQIGLYQSWYGVLAYAFQLYFDFSGYSDMAIGLGRILGIRLPENFRSPYASGSITEFWRRWHITLGAWMRNYLYIPLGGNRASAARVYLNLWIVFLISGLWHGASFTFILWGGWHGLGLVIERLLGKRHDAVPRFLRVFVTFGFVVFGWVLFRSESLGQAMVLLQRMTGWMGPGSLPVVQAIPAFTFALAALLCFMPVVEPVLALSDRLHQPSQRLAWQGTQFAGFFLLFFYAIGEMAGGDAAPFIYFRF